MALFNRSKKLSDFGPTLRRFARILTGTEKAGDEAAKRTLSRLVASDFRAPKDAKEAKVAIFKALFEDLSSENRNVEGSDHPVPHFIDLGLLESAAVSLATLDSLSKEQIAQILAIEPSEARRLIESGLNSITERIGNKTILIMENEPLIAMQLEDIVLGMGHYVAGTVATYDAAVEALSSGEIDLLLADIQLDGKKSGLQAVQETLSDSQYIPVFITAYPERLLGNARVEPTYLVTKPFQEATVRNAITQALFSTHLDNPETYMDLSRERDPDQSNELKFESDFKQLPATVITEISDSKIVLAQGVAAARSSEEPNLQALLTTLAKTSRTTLKNLHSSNSARHILPHIARVDEISAAGTCDDSEALELGLISELLTDMLAENDELLPADLAAIRSLSALANRIASQFQSYNNFRSNTATEALTDPRDSEKLIEFGRHLEELSNEIIDELVIDKAHGSLNYLVENPDSRSALLNFRNTVSNMLTVSLKYIQKFWKDLKSETHSQAVEKFATAVISLPIVGVSHLLTSSLVADIAVLSAILIARRDRSLEADSPNER